MAKVRLEVKTLAGVWMVKGVGGCSEANRLSKGLTSVEASHDHPSPLYQYVSFFFFSHRGDFFLVERDNGP